MAISTSKGEGGMFWEINITPLTDIFLVLLIIFMVTASVAVESTTHINLPVAQNTSPENKGVLVTYTANRELFVNSKDVPEADIETELHDALSRVDAKVVIFQGDRTVLLGDMVRILDMAKAAGAQQIAIAARRAAPGELASGSNSMGSTGD
jgi:biopolymer transport protein ExbD